MPQSQITPGSQVQLSCYIDRVKPGNLSVSWYFANTPQVKYQGITNSTEREGKHYIVYIGFENTDQHEIDVSKWLLYENHVSI